MPRPLAHLYRREGEDFGQKHMGLEPGAIGNTLGEHIGNLIGTRRELEGNMLGTKEKRKNSFPPPSNLKEKKIKAL